MRRTGLARGQGMKLAVSSAPKARKVFVSHPRAGRRTLLGIRAAHLPCAKWSFWWVIFREQTWVTSRERRRIRMSSGFGSSGQKRTPEKVVMEPSEPIQPAKQLKYVGHNSPQLLLSRRAQEPPLPWGTKRRTLLRGGGQRRVPPGEGLTTTPGRLHPREQPRRRWRWRTEQAPLTFRTPGGKDHAAQRSGPRPGNEVFALRRRTGTGQCLVAVTGTSPSTAGVFGLAQSSASAACNLAGTGLRAPGRHLDRSLPATPPSSRERSPSAPACSPPAKPQAPSAFAFRRRSVRSRRTRSAKTSRVTEMCAAISP